MCVLEEGCNGPQLPSPRTSVIAAGQGGGPLGPRSRAAGSAFPRPAGHLPCAQLSWAPRSTSCRRVPRVPTIGLIFILWPSLGPHVAEHLPFAPCSCSTSVWAHRRGGDGAPHKCILPVTGEMRASRACTACPWRCHACVSVRLCAYSHPTRKSYVSKGEQMSPGPSVCFSAKAVPMHLMMCPDALCDWG